MYVHIFVLGIWYGIRMLAFIFMSCAGTRGDLHSGTTKDLSIGHWVGAPFDSQGCVRGRSQRNLYQV